MANPFKIGDKVKAVSRLDGVHAPAGAVFEVYTSNSEACTLKGQLNHNKREWNYENLTTAIAGVDYPIEPSGHRSDGGGVQNHSSGPLYPCVLIYRDGRLCGKESKYDVGVISPRNQEPIWLSTLDAAVLVAEAIKKDLT